MQVNSIQSLNMPRLKFVGNSATSEPVMFREYVGVSAFDNYHEGVAVVNRAMIKVAAVEEKSAPKVEYKNELKSYRKMYITNTDKLRENTRRITKTRKYTYKTRNRLW